MLTNLLDKSYEILQNKSKIEEKTFNIYIDYIYCII